MIKRIRKFYWDNNGMEFIAVAVIVMAAAIVVAALLFMRDSIDEKVEQTPMGIIKKQ